MKLLEERRGEIDEEVLSALEGEPDELYEAAAHLITAGGKRHRPVMTLLSADAVEGDAEDALKAAASVELVHTFSLIQDDIFDNDEIRRGVDSVHAKWGEDDAVLASDLLFSKAFEVLADTSAPASRIVRGLKKLSSSCTRITEGQSMDMSTPTDEGAYMAMIDRKTAELHALATFLGGLIGGGSRDEVAALETFGRKAGLAFQIKDDVIDLVTSSSEMGKPRGSDLLEGKRTLITIHAEEAGDPEVIGLIGRVSEGDENCLPHLVETLRSNGHISFAEERARELVDGAVDALEPLPPTEGKESLLELADYMVERSA